MLIFGRMVGKQEEGGVLIEEPKGEGKRAEKDIRRGTQNKLLLHVINAI